MAKNSKTTRERIVEYLSKDSKRTLSSTTARKAFKNSDPESIMRVARSLYNEGDIRKVDRGVYSK